MVEAENARYMLPWPGTVRSIAHAAAPLCIGDVTAVGKIAPVPTNVNSRPFVSCPEVCSSHPLEKKPRRMAHVREKYDR